MSRQADYQRRMIAQGRCACCGKPRVENDGRFCEVHREQRRTRARACYHATKVMRQLDPSAPAHFTKWTRFPLDAIPLLGTMRDKELAARIGVSHISVWRHRTELRIPVFSPKNSHDQRHLSIA